MTGYEEFLIRDVLKKNGDLQMIVAIEELSELQKEITKGLREKLNKENMAEEIADVLIMISQVKIFFGIKDNEIEKIKHDKFKRIEKMLGE